MKTNSQLQRMGPKESWGSMVKKDFRRNRNLYLLLLPFLLYYLIFMYGPMYGALIAFQDYSPGLGMTASPWVGFKHFVNFFKSPSFGRVLANTFNISLSAFLLGFPAPILLALLLNELKNARFAKIVQNITYLPHFISLVVACGIVKDFTSNTGIVTYIMSLFGFHRVSLLNYPEYFVPVYVLSGIWQEIGWGSIIYLAALTGIDSTQYEAAEIDGAGRLRQAIHVTLPGILPTIVIMFILRAGSILSVGHEKIILLYNDATMEVADVIATYVYQKGLLEQNWSFSTAVGIFNSVVNLVFLVSVNTISRRVNETALW